jgi:aspartokinase-like uncharacterized kinase
MIRRVVKVGGSLLKRSDLAQQVFDWTERQTPAQNLFLFGGGDVINAVRQYDQVHALDSATIHWMCIDLLDVSFTVACSLWPRWRSVHSPQEFCKLTAEQPRQSNLIVKCDSFYYPAQTRALQTSLPLDWRTTTDSIAAFLAVQSDASELVLLKSCEVDDQLSHDEMAQHGIVDAAFASAVKPIASVKVQQLC